MTHRALAQEGPDLRREDISISPPRRRRHRHKGLAPSRSNAVEDSRLGRLSHWPVLPRPQLAGFQVSTEAYHCISVLGFDTHSPRVLIHSLLGSALYGAIVAKVLVARSSRFANWVLPVAGGLLFSILLGLWLTSALWFFTAALLQYQ